MLGEARQWLDNVAQAASLTVQIQPQAHGAGACGPPRAGQLYCEGGPLPGKPIPDISHIRIASASLLLAFGCLRNDRYCFVLQCEALHTKQIQRRCCTLQVQKESAMKEYANSRYDQPYQAALYENSVLLEAQRWHTDEYEKVIGGLESADLEV